MRIVVLIVVVTLLVPSNGCNRDQPDRSSMSADPMPVVGDGHHHGDAPHGGVIADWGAGDYHVEFTVDHDAQSATVYILGDDAKASAPVRAEKLLLSIEEPSFDVELSASPQPGDPEGTASRFTGSHESLGIERELAGTILGEVDGTPYAADFDESTAAHHH